MNGTPDTSRTTRDISGTLRREVPSTVGLLADPGDFAAMRDYRSFCFDHHDAYADYLRHVDALLRTLAAEGVPTTVALFDPDEYADYCTEHGLDPDTAAARTRFTAGLGGPGGLPYTGQPVEELLPLLVDASLRQATREYASMLLARARECADCGTDIGRASFERATDILRRLLAVAGPATTTSSAASRPRTNSSSPSSTPKHPTTPAAHPGSRAPKALSS
ncbi:putative protein OS=Streptomyces lavendulae subsp. lavendulae OX=58340 GN=SLAV_30790 PE=4 SV=1 [Streptomyces lavendulae subsp. lavendulae]